MSTEAFSRFLSGVEWQGTDLAFFRIGNASAEDVLFIAGWTQVFNPDVCLRVIGSFSNGRKCRIFEEASGRMDCIVEGWADGSGARFSVLLKEGRCLLAVGFSGQDAFIGIDSRAGSISSFRKSLEECCLARGLAVSESAVQTAPSILDFE